MQYSLVKGMSSESYWFKIIARIGCIWENRDQQIRPNIYELGCIVVDQEVIFYSFLSIEIVPIFPFIGTL
jgi:hypothetical protein